MADDGDNPHAWIESNRAIHEQEKRWLERRAFLREYAGQYDKKRLICLSNVYMNERMGCKYDKGLMNQVKSMAAALSYTVKETKPNGKSKTVQPQNEGVQESTECEPVGPQKKEEKPEEEGRTMLRNAILGSSYCIDHLESLEPVKKLFKVDKTLYKCYTLFKEGTFGGWKKFAKNNSKLLADFFGPDDSFLEEKMRRLALISMCAERSVVPLEDIAKELDLPNGDEVEELIARVVHSNGIKAKIDGQSGNLNVTWCEQRVFGDKQWRLLAQSIDELLERLAVSSEHILDSIGICEEILSGSEENCDVCDSEDSGSEEDRYEYGGGDVECH